MIRRTMVIATALLSMSAAQADTVQGKVVADGDEVYVVNEAGSVRVLGDTGDVSTLTGRLAKFLNGDVVRIEGTVGRSPFGASMVADRIVSPQFARITASVVYGRGRRHERLQLRWRGQDYPLEGLVLESAPKNTHYEAFMFPNAKRPERIRIVRARVRHGGKPAYLERIDSKRHTAWVPLPPGDKTFLWDFTVDRAILQDRQGKQIARVDPDRLSFVHGAQKRRGMASRLGGS